MNEHISEELRKKWCNYEFIGKPFKLSDGKTYIRAKHKIDYIYPNIHYYCFDTDFFWHSKEEMPIVKK